MSMLSWEEVRARWPGSAHSEFVAVDGIRWHVQRKHGPAGAELLFIHGSGASTHSWAGVVGALPDDLGWMTLDLPGHAFSRMEGRRRPPAGPVDMALHIRGLLDELGATPRIVVGHSAGAAIGLALGRRIGAESVLALNPSLTDALDGRMERALADWVGPLIRSEGTARVAASLARRTGLVDTLLDRTGSRVPEWSRRWYRRLLSDPDHVRAVLRLFSSWRPAEVAAEIDGLTAATEPALHVRAVLGAQDRWIEEADVRGALAPLSRAGQVVVGDGGHLAHEERPTDVVAHIAALVG